MNPIVWLRALFQRRKLDAEMDEEMQFHLEMRTQRLIASGLSPEEAYHAARRGFGGLDQLKEIARHDRGWSWLEQLVQDARYATRTLRRQPGFTALALLTLALGIGANTAIFSVVNAVLLRPLPYPEPDRIVRVWENQRERNLSQFQASLPNFRDWQARSQSWDVLAATTQRRVNFIGHGEPQQLLAQFITAEFLAVHGLQPAMGRGFSRDEEATGRNQVVILSDGLWRRSFGADPTILGRTVHLHGQPHTVIAIGGPEFDALSGSDVFLPLGPGVVSPDREDHTLDVYGRLKPGVSLAQATEEMTELSRRLETEYPETNTAWSVQLAPLFRAIVSADQQRALVVLFAAVAILLLIACANLSSLLLVRASTRARELAIRTALGGGRGRIIRQLVTESTLLALVGGAAGMLLAYWSVEALRSLAAPYLSRAEEIGVDGRVLAFACAATFATGVIAGLIPALQAVRLNVHDALKSGRSGGLGARRSLRNALIVGQLALSIMLLAAAGLLLRNLHQLQSTPLGFATDHVLTVRLSPSQNSTAFFLPLLERLSLSPQIEAAAVTNAPPMSRQNPSTNVFPVGAALMPVSTSVQCEWRSVSADYFQALGIPLLQGRTFTPHDDRNASKVVVINLTLAKMLWGDENPIGRQINPGGGTDYSTVIGVVGDFRSRDPALRPTPAYFMSAYRGMPGPMTLVLRAAGDVRGLVSLVRAEAKAIDATAPLAEIKLLDELVGERLAQPRVQAGLLLGFASLALTLAVIGLYGVMAFATAQRTREVGIRLALGAQRLDVLRPLLRDGAILIAIGGALGLLAAIGTTRFMRSMLTEVSPTDPVVFAATILLLAGTGLIACYLPARRAAKVDPIVALRCE